MRTAGDSALFIVTILLASGALAETTADAKGRYTLTPVEGGTIRLDTETGSLALCTRKADAWACEPVNDKAVSADEKAKLETENKALKERIKALEDTLASGKPPADGGYPAEVPGGVTKLPTEEEVDKALDYVERMFKKFRDRVQKFEKPTDTLPKPGDGGSGAPL
jgi:hypothetical protein